LPWLKQFSGRKALKGGYNVVRLALQGHILV
jgi:hypothetical protein